MRNNKFHLTTFILIILIFLFSNTIIESDQEVTAENLRNLVPGSWLSERIDMDGFILNMNMGYNFEKNGSGYLFSIKNQKWIKVDDLTWEIKENSIIIKKHASDKITIYTVNQIDENIMKVRYFSDDGHKVVQIFKKTVENLKP